MRYLSQGGGGLIYVSFFTGRTNSLPRARAWEMTLEWLEKKSLKSSFSSLLRNKEARDKNGGRGKLPCMVFRLIDLCLFFLRDLFFAGKNPYLANENFKDYLCPPTWPDSQLLYFLHFLVTLESRLEVEMHVAAFCLIFPRFTSSFSRLDAYFSGQVSHACWLALPHSFREGIAVVPGD